MTFSNKSVRAVSLGLLFGVALPLALPLGAQPAPAAAPTRTAEEVTPPAPQAKKPSLSFKDALSRSRFGGGLALAVEVNTVDLSPDDAAKKNLETAERVAQAYSKTTRWFGGVMAIGPQTYTELASDFTGANAFADMPPTQAFTLLMSGLDDGQRAALAGKTGLGFGDLTTAQQKHLFQVLLPDQEVKVWPLGESVNNQEKNLGVLRNNAASVHFRVSQEVQLSCEVANQPYGSIEATNDMARGPKTYTLSYWQHYSNLDKMNGIVMRREVPNRLKRSDLNYDSPRLQVLISIKNLKTVGDLTARIAKQTGIELIAETAYENKKLLLVSGGKESASASELLRALAFSLAGTYRRVGTAFVLTEDLVGVETRRQIIRDFEEECDAERAQAVRDAEKAMKALSAQKRMKLNSFGDPLAMTAEQEKAPAPNTNYHQGLAETALPFDKLSDAQQDAITRFQERVKAHPENFSPQWKPDFSKPIHVIKNSAVQMLISGVDGVIATDFGSGLAPLLQPETRKTDIPADALKMFENMPKWTEAAKAYSRRAIVCRPRSAADVDASLIRIAAQKFNQMWMVVFEDGKARIPGTPLPLDPACDPKIDLLTYAIAEGKKKGITICPVVSTYAWGAKTPPALRLWTIRGEDSAQSAARRFKINSARPPRGMEEFYPLPKDAAPSLDVFVDPTSPTVQTALAGLFRALTAHTGAGSIICRATTPEGFANQRNWRPMRNHDEMGYNPLLRLAFLRKTHSDPVDFRGSASSDTIFRANTSLANYENENDGYGLGQAWDDFRSEALKSAWRGLYETIWNNAGEKKPALLLAQDDGQGFFSWYDDWSDPQSPLPGSNLYAAPPAAESKPGAAPKLPSSVLFVSKQAPSVLPKELAKYDWMDVQMKIMEFYKQARTWDGIVIEE